MYVKKLLKKLTVDYIRHTKSKTGYVSEKTMFLFFINPSLLVTLVEKQKSKVIKQAKKLLQREGLLPLDELLVSWSDLLTL